MQRVAPDAKAFLYGSYARGEGHSESDIDLLILLPDSYIGKEFIRKKLAISSSLYDLSLNLKMDISPLILVYKIFYARRTPFVNNVLNDRIAL